MILPILKYGNPILREKCVPVGSITPAVVQLANDMLETTELIGAVGLAAPQVGHAIQMMLLDVRRSKRPSTLSMKGLPTALESVMPLVLMNVTIRTGQEIDCDRESCASFPGIKVKIARPESTYVTGINLKGDQVEFECGGLLARVVQHELDHLQGILFIDRMSPEVLASVQAQVAALERETLAI